MASISEVEFSCRNNRINSMKNPHMTTCIFFLSASLSGCRQISTQKQVVREVRAESALENEAATMPMAKKSGKSWAVSGERSEQDCM